MHFQQQPKRCLCCGADEGRASLAGFICRTCLRDAQHGGDFAERVKRAASGLPQTCMKCGWDVSCQCSEPDRKPRETQRCG